RPSTSSKPLPWAKGPTRPSWRSAMPAGGRGSWRARSRPTAGCTARPILTCCSTAIWNQSTSGPCRKSASIPLNWGAKPDTPEGCGRSPLQFAGGLPSPSTGADPAAAPSLGAGALAELVPCVHPASLAKLSAIAGGSLEKSVDALPLTGPGGGAGCGALRTGAAGSGGGACRCSADALRGGNGGGPVRAATGAVAEGDVVVGSRTPLVCGGNGAAGAAAAGR